MSLTLEPLAAGDYPPVLAVEKLHAKIASPDLSFVKYLESLGVGPLKMISHFGTEGEKTTSFPTNVDAPFVMLRILPNDPGEDHGAGNEAWWTTVGVWMRVDLTPLDADERVGLRAVHELVRTIYAGWRTGLDPIGFSNLHHYEIVGDMTPDIANPSKGIFLAESFFLVRFRWASPIRG